MSNLFSRTPLLQPLISVETIIDTDVGLIELIRHQYHNGEIFNLDFFNQDFSDIVRCLYRRKEDNPLYLLANDNISHDILDEYYKQFICDKYDDILDNSITTNMIDLLELFNISGDIKPIIYYYTDHQRELLSNIDIVSKFKLVSYNELGDRSKYTILYIKKIPEMKLFSDNVCTTIYISTMRLNFQDDNYYKLKEPDYLQKFIDTNINNITIFDLYKKDIIGEK